MAQLSKLLQQKIPVPYQRNQDTVYIQKPNRFNQFCLIFSLQIKRNTSYILENSCNITKCQMCQIFFDYQSYTQLNVFCFLFPVPIRHSTNNISFFPVCILLTLTLFMFLFRFQFSFQFNSFNSSFLY